MTLSLLSCKKPLYLFFLFSSLFLFAKAQKPEVFIGNISYTNIHSDKIAPAFMGDTAITIDMLDPVIYDQLVKMIPASKLGYVLKYSQRENWPKELSQVTDWHTLENGVFYFMCQFDYRGTRFSLLEMPAAENKKLRTEFWPATDIYIVAGNTSPWSGGSWTDKKNKKKIDYYKDFTDEVARRGWIDSTLYFKNILPVPFITREEIAAQYKLHQELLALDASTRQLNESIDQLAKQKKEAEEKKRKTDSLNRIIEPLIAQLKMLNQPLLDLYKQGKTDEALISAGKWKAKSFNSNETRPRPSGDLRGPVTLHFLESNALSFSRNMSKGGLTMTGEVTIYVRDEEPYDPLWGSRTLKENFYQRMVRSAVNSNKYTFAGTEDRNGILMWDLSGTPLSGFIPKITEYKNEAMADEFSIGLISEFNIVYLTMPTKHFDQLIFMQADVFELFMRIAQLTKTRDDL